MGLQGEVDFHLLETAGADMYGVDSGSGNLLYSSNAGKKWTSRGKNLMSDIAVSPGKVGSALALREGKLISTQNSFTKMRAVDSALTFSSIETDDGLDTKAATHNVMRFSLRKASVRAVRTSFSMSWAAV